MPQPAAPMWEEKCAAAGLGGRQTERQPADLANSQCDDGGHAVAVACGLRCARTHVAAQVFCSTCVGRGEGNRSQCKLVRGCRAPSVCNASCAASARQLTQVVEMELD